MQRVLVTVCLIVFMAGQGFSQARSSKKRHADSLQVSSIVFLPDSLIRDSLHYDYAGIRRFADRWKWTKELYKMFFVYRKKTMIDILEAENSENRFKPHRGKIIRHIRVEVLPPFGTSVRDTLYDKSTIDWVRMFANTLHQRSSEKLIKRQLTIHPGREVHPFELVENELLLKQLSSIDDAIIDLREVEGDTTRVDLVVICKDEFSWTGSGWANFRSSGNVSIENRNLFGLGHILHYELSFRKKEEQVWGNRVEYRMPNIFNTRFDFYGNYENTHANDLFTFQLERPFLTSYTKWAGGALYSRINSSNKLIDRDIVMPVALFNYHLLDHWIGHSFMLPERYSFNQNIFLTARYTATRFHERPEVSSDSNHFYYNRDQYMGAFTYMKLKYFKTNLVYDFGRTEDIPSGLYGSFIWGVERNEFDKFLYMGSEWSYSWYNVHKDRLYSAYIALGSFFNGSTIESGTFRLHGSYISSLLQWGRYRIRCYSDVDYVRGINRFPRDHIYFQDYNIYGFTSDSLRGNQRISLSVSGTLFLPEMVYGFRTAISSYVDMGILAREKEPLLKCAPYWGIGVSLNLRNDNIILKNLSIRFTFYPKIAPDIHRITTNIYTKRDNGFFNYKVTRPEAIRYE